MRISAAHPNRYGNEIGVRALIPVAGGNRALTPISSALLVTPWVGPVTLDVFFEQLQLALLGGLAELPAVVRRHLRAGTAVAMQVSEEVLLDAAPDVGSRTDVQHRLPPPQHIYPAPLVRGVLDGRLSEWPLGAAHRHRGAVGATVVPQRRCSNAALSSAAKSK